MRRFPTSGKTGTFCLGNGRLEGLVGDFKADIPVAAEFLIG